MANNGDVSMILKHVPELAGSLTNAMPVEAVDAEVVANAVAWLASDEAHYVTGTVLPVDADNVHRSLRTTPTHPRTTKWGRLIAQISHQPSPVPILVCLLRGEADRNS